MLRHYIRDILQALRMCHSMLYFHVTDSGGGQVWNNGDCVVWKKGKTSRSVSDGDLEISMEINVGYVTLCVRQIRVLFDLIRGA
jgi:hypothetical protein